MIQLNHQGPRMRLLSRADVTRLLDVPESIDAVDAAFRAAADGTRARSGVLGIPATHGGFHAKAAILADGEARWFAAKLNANFPENPKRHGLPTIQGVLALFDGQTGQLLALMDSIALTVLRTAAATGVAARYLSNPAAAVVTVVGCGAQARAQLGAVAAVRSIRHVTAVDLDAGTAERVARDVEAELAIEARAATDLSSTLASDIIVTCTPSRRPFLGPEHVRSGAFVAAVGADNEDKSEIEPELMRRAEVVVDHLDQCADIGDLHHAIAAGVMTKADVRATLSAVVSDPRLVAWDPARIVVFDSTGVAIQDAATAALVFKRAVAVDAGLEVSF